jgi:hypothetical protein
VLVVGEDEILRLKDEHDATDEPEGAKGSKQVARILQ